MSVHGNLGLMQAQAFLEATLGADGYQALSKAAERLPELQSVFVPRTVIAWLSCAARLGFEGQVPGTEATITKGELLVDGYTYETQDLMKASAALTMHLMDEVSIPEELDPKQIARLAKSVDALTKARFISMCKALEREASHSHSADESSSSESSEYSTSCSSAEESHGDLDLAKGIEDMSKAQGWKSSDGLIIPKGGTPERQEWDTRYRAKLVDRFANGDKSKLTPVKIPVNEHSFGHYVPGEAGAKNLDRYRVPMYQKMLAGGDKLPPLLVQRAGQGWKVIDGNARLKAALQHGKTPELDALELKKGIEEPGRAGAPTKPLAPDAPDAPQKAPQVGMGQAKPTPVVSRARGFYKSELVKACGRCGETQMRGRAVVGCLCITTTIQSVDLIQKNEGDRIILIGSDLVLTELEECLGLTPA